MLTHFAIGPYEDQTYCVACMHKGARVATVVYEHLTEQDAIKTADTINKAQANISTQLEAARLASRMSKGDY